MLDLPLRGEGIITALDNEDYEQGTVHVPCYLVMNKPLLKRTAENVWGDSASGSFIVLQ